MVFAKENLRLSIVAESQYRPEITKHVKDFIDNLSTAPVTLAQVCLSSLFFSFSLPLFFFYFCFSFASPVLIFENRGFTSSPITWAVWLVPARTRTIRACGRYSLFYYFILFCFVFCFLSFPFLSFPFLSFPFLFSSLLLSNF